MFPVNAVPLKLICAVFAGNVKLALEFSDVPNNIPPIVNVLEPKFMVREWITLLVITLQIKL